MVFPRPPVPGQTWSLDHTSKTFAGPGCYENLVLDAKDTSKLLRRRDLLCPIFAHRQKVGVIRIPWETVVSPGGIGKATGLGDGLTRPAESERQAKSSELADGVDSARRMRHVIVPREECLLPPMATLRHVTRNRRDHNWRQSCHVTSPPARSRASSGLPKLVW